MKKFAVIVMAVLMLLTGCGKDKKNAGDEKPPKNIPSYEDKSAQELIPNGETVEHGDVVEADEADADIPSEDELGEYQEIFMEGDIIDDETCAGWVLATSLDDITVNTYNEITKYALDGSAPSAVAHIKPGDAVLVQYTQDEEGAKTAYYLGRVRVEDEPMTREEVIEKYKNSMGDGEQQ